MSEVQKRFGFPENSVELFAERVERLAQLRSEVLQDGVKHKAGVKNHMLLYVRPIRYAMYVFCYSSDKSVFYGP